MTNEDYHEKFKILSEAYEACGGSIGREEGLIEQELAAYTLTIANANAAQISTA